MFVEPFVRDGHIFLVPAVISGFVTTQEHDGDATRVERKKHPIGTALVLDAELAH